MNAQTVAIVASPVVSLVGAALVTFISARSQTAATKHRTENDTAVELSKQLLGERAQLLERLDRNVMSVKNQVTNGGSNLAATVGDTSRRMSDLTDDMRVIRADLSGLAKDVRDLRGTVNALKRTL